MGAFFSEKVQFLIDFLEFFLGGFYFFGELCLALEAVGKFLFVLEGRQDFFFQFGFSLAEQGDFFWRAAAFFAVLTAADFFCRAF